MYQNASKHCVRIFWCAVVYLCEVRDQDEARERETMRAHEEHLFGSEGE